METKRKTETIKHIVIGMVKFALFSTTILLGEGLLNQRIEINSDDLLIIIIISVIAPIIGWFINKYRHKKYIG